MTLISCDNCCVVLDANKLVFPDQKSWWHEDGTINAELAGWRFWGYRAKVACPVCHADIFSDQTVDKVID